MMTPKQNRGPGKRRPPAVPLDYYEKRFARRNTSLFFVFYHGEVTERNYFDGVSRDLIPNEEDRSRFLRLRYTVGTPQQVVEAAQTEIQNRAGDRNDVVWVVFDRDDFTSYSEAISLAESKGMKAAYSNECFELWLLLHFQDVDQPCGRGRLSEALRRRWEELSGTTIESPGEVKHFPYNLLYHYGNLEEAIARARELYRKAIASNHAAPWDVNPVTTVYQLIENLGEFFADLAKPT